MTIRFDALCVRELRMYIYNNQNKRIANDFDNNNNNIFLLECSKQRVVKNRRRRRQLFFTREGVIDSRSNLLHVDEVSAGGGKQSHQYLRNVMHRILDRQVVLEPIKLRVPRVQDTA